MIKAIAICIVCMLMDLCTSAQIPDTATQQLSLQQCILIALQNNADVQHANINAAIEKTTWQGSKGNMIPTLNADISHGINSGRSIDPYTNTYSNQNTGFANYSLNTGITLFNAFAVQNNIKQNKLAFQASEYELQQSKDAIALNVILEYLQVLTNEDLLNVSTQQSNVSAKQVDRLNILNSDGAISPGQLYDLKGEYANNELNVVNAQNNLETAKVLLAQLLNIPYNKKQEVERLSLADISENNRSSADSIYRSALQNLAIIKATELRKQSADFSVKTYRSQRYPSIFFSGGLYTNYSSNATLAHYLNTTNQDTKSYILSNADTMHLITPVDNFRYNKINYGNQFKNNFFTTFSVGIRIPLLNNLQNKTQIKTAELQQQYADVTFKATKTQLQQNVEQAYINITAAGRRYDVLTEQVNAFKESFREAEIKFNAGSITSIDYLVVKNNLDQANINLIVAQYNYVLRSMILDYYSGRLTF